MNVESCWAGVSRSGLEGSRLRVAETSSLGLSGFRVLFRLLGDDMTMLLFSRRFRVEDPPLKTKAANVRIDRFRV